MSYTTNYCLEYDLYLDRSAACGICVENAYFLQFLLLLSLIPVSALTSAWLVAKFVYEPHMRQVENEKDWSDYEEEEEEELYEDKYCLDFVSKNDDKKNHDSLMVQESTPDGSVFMKWNEENESFDYWCDNKEIKYVYLEVVARKYCTMFGCPEIYIDRGKEGSNENKDIFENLVRQYTDSGIYFLSPFELIIVFVDFDFSISW